MILALLLCLAAPGGQGLEVDRVRGERGEPLPEEQETLMGIVDACYRSSEEGREIVL